MSILMNTEKVAEILGTTANGIYHRIRRKQIPPPISIGGTKYWRKIDWDAWLELQAQKAGASFVEDKEKQEEPIRRRRGRPRKEK